MVNIFSSVQRTYGCVSSRSVCKINFAVLSLFYFVASERSCLLATLYAFKLRSFFSSPCTVEILTSASCVSFLALCRILSQLFSGIFDEFFVLTVLSGVLLTLGIQVPASLKRHSIIILQIFKIFATTRCQFLIYF